MQSPNPNPVPTPPPRPPLPWDWQPRPRAPYTFEAAMYPERAWTARNFDWDPFRLARVGAAPR